MIRQSHALILVALSVLGALLSVCSGGGSSSSPSVPSVPGKSVYWTAPQYFTDNTPLDPSRDLEGFEIYIKQDPAFGPADIAVVTTLPQDNSFYLGNITPPLTPGVTYYVSLRTVTVYGMRSDFSPPVAFSP